MNSYIISRKILLIFAVCFFQLISMLQSTAQSTAQYSFNDQDVLKIRVGSWDVTRNAYVEWQGLSGDYTVGPDGKISFPYVGTITVRASNVEQVSQEIAKKLKISIGLPELPAVAIEISSYNPVFVTGDVYRPGQYEYRPGMSVRQAVAMAGGIGRAGGNSIKIERDILHAFGQRRLLIQNQQRLLLRISRLEAEINEETNYVAPEEIQARILDSGLVDIEKDIFANNTEALKQRILSVEELIVLLRNVLEKLDRQLALSNEEITRTEADLIKKRKSLARGTLRASDVANAARALTNLRLREIELTVDKLRVEQSLNESEREKIDIKKKNKAVLLQQLDEARTLLTDLALTIDMQTDLYTSALVFGAKNPEASLDMSFSILVIGHGEDVANDSISNEQTKLRPGDTVVIRIPETISETDQSQ